MTWQTLRVVDDPIANSQGSIRTITLNRPAVLNALSLELITELCEVFKDTAATASVRGVLLTGEGKAFAAGADIASMAELSPSAALTFAQKGHDMGNRLEALAVPTVAAVNGFALGGGCELALACDFIYASAQAKFGQPEVKLGVIPGFGGTQRLSRRIGLAHALELCMTGDLIDAPRAVTLGLVNRVFPPEQLVAQARATLERIAAQGPLAVTAAKEVLHRGAQRPLREALELEAQAFAALFASDDQKEGMTAFLAKRPPHFRGR